MLLVTVSHGRQVVASLCAQARAAGVTEGMDVSHARALLAAGAVHVSPHDPQRDAQALDALAHWAVRFSPVVAADPPDGLLIDIAGCDRLYHGDSHLMQAVVRAITQHGFAVRAAVAPTIGLAWALARYGEHGSIVAASQDLKPHLADLPIHALRLDAQVIEALSEIAVTRIGDLYPLARQSLMTRFGATLLLRLDQALGDAMEWVDPVHPATCPQVVRDFAGPVTQIEAIELTVRELLDELAMMLARLESGATLVVLLFDRIDTEQIRHAINLSAPCRDAKHLWALARPLVERLHMGYGVERVTITAPKTARVTHEQATCFVMPESINPAHANRAMGGLIDELCARLGPDRVRAMDVRESHLPEAVFSPHPMTRVQPVSAIASLVDADRPSVLYLHPQPVNVMLLAPHGPLLSFHAGGVSRRARTTLGPERITTPWWAAENRSRRRQTRDYFKIQDTEGCWWWLYREWHSNRWFIHGRWS